MGIVFAAGVWFFNNNGNGGALPLPSAIVATSTDATASPAELPVAQASYKCANGETITAAFYKGEQKTAEPGQPPVPNGSVKIALSDGRSFDLPQTISADGGRYANNDESFVFWDKGGTALVLENGKEIDYTGCVAAVQAEP